MANRTLICPPSHMAAISGIKWIEVGARKVWCVMETMTFTLPRCTLPAILPDEYMALSEHCYDAVRSGHASSCKHRGIGAN